MPVLKFLDLSTAHITEQESVAIDQGFPELDDVGPRVIRHDYGWWLHVYDEASFADDLHLQLVEHYPNVAACLVMARELDCTWINFDQDAGHEEGLPVHDW